MEYLAYQADWSLVAEDANIDGGTIETVLDMLPIKDAYGNNRIRGETIDIGAVEFDPLSVVSQESYSEEVDIYPNPFSGQLWVDIKHLKGKLWHLNIWSQNGQLLNSFDIKHQISSINSSNWPVGMYLVEGINQSGERIFTRKIIKGR